MALDASFTATQSMADPNLITFTDTSTGTDVTITTRTITIRLANRNWLDEDGNESATVVSINWDYADTSIVLDLISQSQAPSITVVWYAGAVETYTDTDTFCWNFYDYLFGLQLLQGQTSNPGIVQDTNYYSNLCQYVTNIWLEENAIRWGGDIYSSQGAMSRNYLMETNENSYF
jgi:hypothetical protein